MDNTQLILSLEEKLSVFQVVMVILALVSLKSVILNIYQQHCILILRKKLIDAHKRIRRIQENKNNVHNGNFPPPSYEAIHSV